MLGKPPQHVHRRCLLGIKKSPQYRRRKMFKVHCFAEGKREGKTPDEPKDYKVESQDLHWEDCSWGKFGERDDPDRRRSFTIRAFKLVDRTVYRQALKVYKTAREAIEMINSSGDMILVVYIAGKLFSAPSL